MRAVKLFGAPLSGESKKNYTLPLISSIILSAWPFMFLMRIELLDFDFFLLFPAKLQLTLNVNFERLKLQSEVH